MFVLVLDVELHVPASHSLKDKRQVVSALLDGARRRYGVSVAEVDHQDQWQRASIGVAVVAESQGHLREILDSVERFVDHAAAVEVLDVETTWLEPDA
jgi:uncharacterized protein YlxP (DUF503 family)